MHPAIKIALRLWRWVGVPLIIISIIPFRPSHDWWSVLYSIFGVLACIPYSLLRTGSLFWSFFSLYVLATVALVVQAVASWSRFGHLDVMAVILVLNIVAQPICILVLRHYRRIVPNTALEPTPTAP